MFLSQNVCQLLVDSMHHIISTCKFNRAYIVYKILIQILPKEIVSTFMNGP